MAKKQKKSLKIKILRGQECPYLKNHKYCTHKSNGGFLITHSRLCPYVRNRKRCSLWGQSVTKLKSVSESLKINKKTKKLKNEDSKKPKFFTISKLIETFK